MRSRTACSCSFAIPALIGLGLFSRVEAGPIENGATLPAGATPVPADARSDGNPGRPTRPGTPAGGGTPTGRASNPGRRPADDAAWGPISNVPEDGPPSLPPRTATGTGSMAGAGTAGRPGGSSIPAIPALGGATGPAGVSAPVDAQGQVQGQAQAQGVGKLSTLADPTPSSGAAGLSGGAATNNQGVGSGSRVTPAAQDLSSPVAAGTTGDPGAGAGSTRAAGASSAPVAFGGGVSAPSPGGGMATNPSGGIPGNAGALGPIVNTPYNSGNLPGAVTSGPTAGGGAGNAAGGPSSGSTAGASGNGALVMTPAVVASAGGGVAPLPGASSPGGAVGTNANPLASIYTTAVLNQILSPSSGSGTASKDNNASATATANVTPSATGDHGATATGGAIGVGIPSVRDGILEATTNFRTHLTGANVTPSPIGIQDISSVLPPVQAGDPVRQDASTGVPGAVLNGPVVNLDIPEPGPLFLLLFASSTYLGRNTLRRCRLQPH